MAESNPAVDRLHLEQLEVDVRIGYMSRTEENEPVAFEFRVLGAIAIRDADRATPNQFAERRGLPLLRSGHALSDGQSPTTDIQKYFQDQCHMNERGTQKFGQGLAGFLSTLSPISNPVISKTQGPL